MKNILLLITLACTLNLSGQDSIKVNKSYWLDLGAGVFKAEDLHGYSTQISLNYQIKSNQFKIKYSVSKEYNITGSYNFPLECYKELNGLYGKSIIFKNCHVSALLGLSFFTGNKRGKYLYANGGSSGFGGGFDLRPFDSFYEDKNFSTIGLPLDLEILTNTFGFLNFGIDYSINFNSERTLYSFLIKVSIGKIE